MEVESAISAFYGYEALVGIGAGAYTQANFAVIQPNVESKDIGGAITLMLLGKRTPSRSLYYQTAPYQAIKRLTGSFLSAQLCGLSFGLSIAGAIFLNVAQNSLSDLLPDTPLPQLQQIISGTSGGLLNTLSPEVRAKALEMIVHAWQKV